MAGRGCENLLEDRQGSGGPPKGLKGDGSFSRMARRGEDTLPEGWEGSGGPYEGQQRVVRPSWRVRRGWEGLGVVGRFYRWAGRG